MRLPTEGEEFAKLIEHIRLGQEAAAMLAHLAQDKSSFLATQWLLVEEHLKAMQHTLVKIAMRKMQ